MTSCLFYSHPFTAIIKHSLIKENLTMKEIILSIALITASSAHAGECSRQETSDEFESPIAYMDESYDENIGIGEELEREISSKMESLKTYEDRLSRFLAKSDDIKIQLSSINSFYINDINTTENKYILKKAINLDSDKYTLFLADNICHSNTELSQWCHTINIHDIHYQVDPENLFTYLFNIHKSDEINHINDTVLLAAEYSTYSDSFFYHNIIELAEKFSEFNDFNPDVYADFIGVDDIDYLNQVEEMDKLVVKLQLIEKGIVPKDYHKSMNENHSIIYAIGKEMANTVSFYHISDACKSIENETSCLTLAKLMQSDKTIMNKLMGFSIEKNIKKELGEVPTENQNKTSDAIYQVFLCYSQVEDIMYAHSLNKDLMIEYIQNADQFGELIAAKKMAYSIYNTEKKHGYNPDFNPKNCD